MVLIMNKFTGFLSLIILLTACTGIKDPRLVKYEAYAAEVDQKAARGVLTQMEDDNLKIQAYQEYQAERRREEQRLLNDTISQQVKSQNQEINSVLRQARPSNT